MQALSPKLDWARLVQQPLQSTQASGPSTVQTPAAQNYVGAQEQQAGEQTLAELLKLQQQQQSQVMPLGQNYLRQLMPPASTNYFQQLY